jgi:hypothetical protein
MAQGKTGRPAGSEGAETGAKRERWRGGPATPRSLGTTAAEKEVQRRRRGGSVELRDELDFGDLAAPE